jgi:membrane protein required for colicin V production
MFGLPYTRPLIATWIPTQAWVDPVAFFATFLISLIVLMLIARLIGSLVRGSVLGGVDRTLGLLFGLARGAAMVVVAYILGAMIFPMERWPPVVLNARSLMPAYAGAVWVRSQLPEEYRPRIYPPPSIREATADDLMRATPQGRATDKASARN